MNGLSQETKWVWSAFGRFPLVTKQRHGGSNKILEALHGLPKKTSHSLWLACEFYVQALAFPRFALACFTKSLLREDELVMMSPVYTKGAIASATKSLFEGNPTASDAGGSVSWTPRRGVPTSSEGSIEVLQSVRLPRGSGRVIQIMFHRKGDYFSSLCK